jgi:CRP-like cAMP-binding protein
MPEPIFKQMAASYLGRWDLVQLRCANIMSCTLEERLTLTLLSLARVSESKNKRGIRLTIPTRHKALADLLGATRPRVTEYLLKFEHDNLIFRDAHDMIIRRDRLENFLAETHSRGN